MAVVTILGAGGAMGRRVTRGLQGSGEQHELRFVEPNAAAQQRMLDENGAQSSDLDAALDGADVVVLATPDRIVSKVTADLMPRLAAGTSILCLDPAAAYAGRIPRRDDVNLFVVHPTHPPLYDLIAEPSIEARTDYWGGGRAHQALVFAQGWGDETRSAMVQELAKQMFAPISRVHVITVDQMILLEPAMSESVTLACIGVMKETRERVKSLGVPEAAVDDFFFGHLQIGLALILDKLDWKLSAGAIQAMKEARSVLFKDDWDRILSEAEVLSSARRITSE